MQQISLWGTSALEAAVPKVLPSGVGVCDASCGGADFLREQAYAPCSGNYSEGGHHTAHKSISTDPQHHTTHSSGRVRLEGGDQHCQEDVGEYARLACGNARLLYQKCFQEIWLFSG